MRAKARGHLIIVKVADPENRYPDAGAVSGVLLSRGVFRQVKAARRGP